MKRIHPVFIVMLLAIMLITSCETLTPKERHYGQGIVYLEDGRFEKAELAFREVLKIEQECPEAEFNIALIADLKGDLVKAKLYYNLAIKHFTEKMNAAQKDTTVNWSVESNNDLANCYNNLGQLFIAEARLDKNMSNRKFREAANQFEQALKFNDKNPQIYKNLGHAKMMLDELDSAIEYLKEAIKVDPSFAQAYLSLADIYEEIGKIDLAKEHHSTARQLGMDDEVVREKLDWWADWKEFQVVQEPKISFPYPADWSANKGKVRAGRVLLVFEDTFAVCYGEGAGTLQVVGPDSNYSYLRRGENPPYIFAQKGLIDFLKSSSFPEDLARSVDEQQMQIEEGIEPETKPADEMPATEKKQTWNVDLKTMERFNFKNGTNGAAITIDVVWSTGEVFKIRLWFYLGQQHSFILVGTYQIRENNEEQKLATLRTSHAMEYMASYFDEMIIKSQ